MRKKTLRYLVPCMAMALCSISFTSCSDDDEGGIPSGPSITFGGENLMSVDDYIFWYDGNGRCYKVSDGWNDDVVEIDYETGMIRSDDLGTEMNISFNSKGYITSLSASWNLNEDGEKYSGSGKWTFSYNGSGQLTGEKINSKESYSSEYEAYDHSMTLNTTYKWEGGNLMSGSTRMDAKEDGDEYTMTDDFTVSYDETLENPHRQFPRVFYKLFSNGLTDSYLHLFGMVGMFGVGPENLPESYEDVFEEEGYEPEHFSGTVSYGLNADGYFDWERINGYRYDYEYGMPNVGGGQKKLAPRTRQGMSAGKTGHWVRDMFMRYRDRK